MRSTRNLRFVLVLVFTILACNLNTPGAKPTVTPDLTIAALSIRVTMYAELTATTQANRQATVGTPASLTSPSSPNATDKPSSGNSPVSTPISESEHRLRIRMSTTSDWTTFGLTDGAFWFRPSLISASNEVTYSWLEDDRFLLAQPLERAKAGESVEMIFEFSITNIEDGGKLVFEIERGDLGATKVELFNYLGTEPVLLEIFESIGTNSDERNARAFQLPAETLLYKAP